MTAEWLDPAEITAAPALQARAALSTETIAEYAQAMRDSEEYPFPAVIVIDDGQTKWLADGFHRHAAAASIGIALLCEVRDGTKRDALRAAISANAGHGLRRTNADKRRAVELALADEEIARLSTAEIARLCGVSRPMVETARQDATVASSERMGADGKLYPARRESESTSVEYDEDGPASEITGTEGTSRAERAAPQTPRAAPDEMQSYKVATDLTADEIERLTVESTHLADALADLAGRLRLFGVTDKEPQRIKKLIAACELAGASSTSEQIESWFAHLGSLLSACVPHVSTQMRFHARHEAQQEAAE